jgi:cytochrome P450
LGRDRILAYGRFATALLTIVDCRALKTAQYWINLIQHRQLHDLRSFAPLVATGNPMNAPTSASRLRQFDDLPGPRGVPVFGNLLQIDSTRLHLQLEQWCKEHGPIFKLRLGPRRAVVLGDHELIATALRDRPDGFRRTTKLEQVWTELGLMGGVFGANGETWRRQRRMVMAAFDPVHVKRYHPALQRVGLRLAKRWQQAARHGATIDLQADLMRFTVDAIAGLAFGAEVNTLESDEDVIQKHLNRIFPASRLFRCGAGSHRPKIALWCAVWSR